MLDEVELAVEEEARLKMERDEQQQEQEQEREREREQEQEQQVEEAVEEAVGAAPAPVPRRAAKVRRPPPSAEGISTGDYRRFMVSQKRRGIVYQKRGIVYKNEDLLLQNDGVCSAQRIPVLRVGGRWRSCGQVSAY